MSVPVAIRASAERLVIAATMGPTIHDVHAWRFKVVPGLIEVHADPDRFRPAHDPAGRGLHLSSGAALVNLRLAAAQLGYEAVVRLLPDVGRPTVLATVRLAGHHRVTRQERLLYASTLKPFASLSATAGTCPSLPVVNELGEAARLEGAALRLLPPILGATVQRAVLTTRGDSPAEWLRAGQALQRVLLSGTARSVSMSFVHEGLHVPGAQDVIEPGEVPQVLLQLTQAVPARTLAGLLKPSEDRKDEGQRHWEWVR
ncbi:hypothetical protein [Actinomadura rubrisoli]|uniref:hypothetical protein n=1 Tax=Actinomadura rubrisoli TaxID=2530368 RepID=UPI001A9FC15F|nr:hypothetical protein [Actinomadura rubrisoli]